MQITGEGSREVHLIVGRSGNGKTTLLRQMMMEEPRAIAFDPLGILYPGIICYGRSALVSMADKLAGNEKFKLIFRPQKTVTDFQIMQDEAEYACSIAWELENIGVYFDEIDSFARASDERSKLLALINWGRNKNISVKGTVRRPVKKIPRDWVTEITRYSIFCTKDPFDLNAISQWTMIKPEEIRELAIFEYFDWIEGEFIRKKLEKYI